VTPSLSVVTCVPNTNTKKRYPIQVAVGSTVISKQAGRESARVIQSRRAGGQQRCTLFGSDKHHIVFPIYLRAIPSLTLSRQMTGKQNASSAPVFICCAIRSSPLPSAPSNA
jgi:hypothetical protein